MTDNEIISALEVFLKAIKISGEQYIDISAETLAGTLNLIYNLKAYKEALIAGQETLQKALAEKNAKIEALQMDNAQLQSDNANANMNCEHLQAEIERLSDRNHKCIYLSDDETTEYCVDGPCSKFKTESQIKAEAIKEFAKELINRFSKNNLTQGFYVNISEIDLINLVKEMVGDTE